MSSPRWISQNVPQDDEDVVGGVTHLFQQPLEEGEVAVDIADHQHPPVRREGQRMYAPCMAITPAGLPGRSSRSFPGGR